MSTLIDIIEEEIERLEKLSIFYKKEISKLPKGYISSKKIKGHIYLYYSFRKGNTVKNIYIGGDSSKKLKEIKERIQERKKLEALLKQAKQNLAEAKKALRAKK